MVPLICHWHLVLLVLMVSPDQKSYIVPHLNCLDLRNPMVSWKYLWHHMMSVSIVSYDQKSHFAHHFDCLDLRNPMVLLMLPWPSCYAGPKGII